MKASILFPLAFGIFTKISATPLGSDFLSNIGNEAITLASAWIGEAEHPEIQETVCLNSYQGLDALERQSDPITVCGARCTPNCFRPAGNGPDPNDCHVIAENLRNDVKTKGPYIDIPIGGTVQLQYKSCATFFRNQAPEPLRYCRKEWANAIDFVAYNCQAVQNAHGGICVADDRALGWYIQVYRS